jgi:hypothetical protein
MAATAGLSLTVDPMGKMFQIASSLTETTWTIETKLHRNDHWKVLYKVSVFYADRKSKMAAFIVLTQDHMGKIRNMFFSEAIALVEPKLCINHWKVLYKLCVFYVDRNSKMTTTAGHNFYIGPIGSFFNQVNDTGS